jgi:acyl-CoA hydrolase
MPRPTSHDDVSACVDFVLDRVGTDLRVGIPLGVGKPNHFINELFRRACRDPAIRLDVFTALSPEPPSWSSELERRLVEPLRDRLYAGWPELDYAASRRRGELPDNVRIVEFYLVPGKLLGNHDAQQDYVSTNYGDVAGELRRRGLDVLAQLVAPDPETAAAPPAERRFSLSSNPDLTLDLLPYFDERRRRGEPIAVVGQVNRELPYMFGDAEVPATTFDAVLDGPGLDFPLFGAPNLPLATTDWFVGLWASALVRDGGTLQLGIGTLSNAVSQMLIRRHRDNDTYRDLLAAAGSAAETAPLLAVGGEEPFERGLYASTEMLVEGLLALYQAGILSRRVVSDAELQRDVDAGADLPPEEQRRSAVAHAGFFFGSSAFYRGLRELSDEGRRELAMTRISWTNRLEGDHELKQAQRRHARFLNETMMVTALGAAVSDALDDGRMVSGVGGQHDFVVMAHRLAEGRSVLMLPSTRHDGRRLRSNVRWSYGHATIPRHLRDLVVTEYGAADLRGKTDREVIEAMLSITDARFLDEIVASAKAAGKLPRGYQVSDRCRANLPERLEKILAPYRGRGFCPRFPLGTDLEEIEVDLGRALRSLRELQGGGWAAPSRLGALVRDLGRTLATPAAARPYLERMGLERPRGFSQRLQRRAVLLALVRAGLI